jgi:ribonucleoside-diphosphate reductase alpha chain
MGFKGKILVTDEGQFDLASYDWDDQQFSNILTRENPIETDQALDISRFLREKIASMETQTITMPLVDKILENKLMEYGLAKTSLIRLDRSIFIRNGLVLSSNAKNVLKRRYLKKDLKGKVTETPKDRKRWKISFTT